MSANQFAHPLDAIIPDPAGREPLCDEAEFGALVNEIVTEHAPRLFAVVQEYGNRVDARIAAWGMAFNGRAVVTSTRGGAFQTLARPEHAVRLFTRGTRVSSRLVWVGSPPDEAGAPE
jgi:hypothetical protein